MWYPPIVLVCHLVTQRNYYSDVEFIILLYFLKCGFDKHSMSKKYIA